MSLNRILAGIILIILVLPGCTRSSRSTDLAQETLNHYFDALAGGDYTTAVNLYGGSYEILQGYNPDIDPQDHATLWQRGCESNGLNCLKSRSVEFVEMQGDIYIFNVEFLNVDGSLFVLGPCCGADETVMPPKSNFNYRVQLDPNGNYLVLDPPVYTP